MNDRKPVPFDKTYFENLAKNGNDINVHEKFKFIYESNFWDGGASVSGEGSDDIQTLQIRKYLPILIEQYNIITMLDLPCGDFNWMKDVNLKLEHYIGGDIVEDIIQQNIHKYSNSKREFKKLNIIDDELPQADLLFCRDCLVHLSYQDINKSIENIKSSGIKYLMATTFPDCEENKDITTGDWRILNLEKVPFNFPKPLFLLNENCTEGEGTYKDKSIGLWEVSEL